MHAVTRIVITAMAALLAAAAVLVPAQPASATDWCGYVATAPGTVITLTEDLHCSDHGITVRADNVTIDLGGYTISGSASTEWDPVLGVPAGVLVYGATNTVILNGRISGFMNGLAAIRSTATRVSDLAIERTHQHGIRLADSTRVALTRVLVTGVGLDAPYAIGISGENVRGLSADAVTVSHWADAGISLATSTDITISNSVVEHNLSDGINLWGPSGRVVIDRTVASDNGGDHIGGGIVIAHSSPSGSVTVSHSTTRRNCLSGIYTMNVTNLAITDVGADDNGSEGIWLDSGIEAVYGTSIPFSATIRESTANANVHGGFSLGFAGRWTLAGNRAEGNGDSGFWFQGGQVNLRGNTSSGNADNGYTWSDNSSGTSTGDTGSGNTGYGVLVATGGASPVTLVDASMTGNRAGAVISTGRAVLTRGNFSYNRLEGIRASNGSLNAQRVTAIKNGGNGIAFLPGSTGAVDHVTASKNGRYGLCITKGLAIADVPPHTLLSNGIAPRGTRCTVGTLGG